MIMDQNLKMFLMVPTVQYINLFISFVIMIINFNLLRSVIRKRLTDYLEIYSYPNILTF